MTGDCSIILAARQRTSASCLSLFGPRRGEGYELFRRIRHELRQADVVQNAHALARAGVGAGERQNRNAHPQPSHVVTAPQYGNGSGARSIG